MLCLRFRGKLYNVNLLCYNIVRKYTIGKDLDLPGDYRLLIFDQLKFRHGGVNFTISQNFPNH